MTGRRSRLSVLGCVIAVLALLLASSPAAADGPPSPPPYPKVLVVSDGPEVLTCTDSDGTLLYEDVAWTLEPLVRGPFFAPVVLWLQGRGNSPVVPLEFSGFGFPMIWETVDDGPRESGEIFSWGGRPVAYGPTPNDPAARVRCSWHLFGFYEFGTYSITAGLARALGLPATLVGRRVLFSNEGSASFTVPRYLFPLTASRRVPTLPTPDYLLYGRRALPPVTCLDAGRTRYSGSAYSLAPLVRGYQWAPMAFWLAGDRVVTPRWFTAAVRGTWRTVSGTPVVSGTLSADQAARPSGIGGPLTDGTTGVDCTWGGTHLTTTTVRPALAAQLSLPSSLIGRVVELSGTYTTRAYVPTWLFPPA